MKHCGQCGQVLHTNHDESGHLHLACPGCQWTWYDPPTPVTLVLVTTADGQVVYTRKNSFPSGLWSVVSGFIPKGERAEEAAVREIKEETGLDARIVEFMGTHVYPRRPDQIVIAFRALVTGGELQAGDDVDEVEIGPPDVSRVRPGSTSHWLVESFIKRQG